MFTNATCLGKLTETSFAVGFENSLIHVYSLYQGKLRQDFVIDHKMPQSSIQGLVFDGSYIIAAVNGVGIFKWLYIKSTQTNPECSEQAFASLVKIMPVARGFQINTVSKHGHELLVACSDSHLLKYEATLGYSGYYQSQNLSEIYDILEIAPTQGASDMCAIAGKTISKDLDDDDTVCVEIVQLKTNSLLIKLIF